MNTLHEELAEKVESCWSAYMHRFLSWQPLEILGMIEEIAAAQYCYDQLVHNADAYPDDLLVYLLRYDNPLEVMMDRWLEEQDVIYNEDFETAMWDIWQYGPEPESSSETPNMTM